VPVLRRAIADHQHRFHGLVYDPDDEVSVTFGATEALASTILAMCEPGDEVVVLEPAYDAYAAVVAMAGATLVSVPLTRGPGPHGQRFAPDLEALDAAITPAPGCWWSTPRTTRRAPSSTRRARRDRGPVRRPRPRGGHRRGLRAPGLHRAARPLATRPGMRERTVTISSAGKTFSCTGWKIGWACAPPALTAAVRTTKQFLSFSGGTPLQHAVAHALGLPDEVHHRTRQAYRARRDRLHDGLVALGLPSIRPEGGYFVTADVAPLGFDDGEAFCRWAPAAVGVAAVPVSAFVRDPAPVRSLVRFAFCKHDEVIDAGLERLAEVREVRR
jgi:N-succinyldiaminopimelate aminotransferase